MVWHPLSLELVRSGSMAIVVWLLFAREARSASPRVVLLLVLTNVLTALSSLFFLYSYQHSGIVYTVLLYSLQPLLVYAAAILFLKEKFHWKKFVAFVFVLASIVVAQAFA